MPVQLTINSTAAPPILPGLLERRAVTLLSLCHRSDANLSLLCTDDSQIQQLNSLYRQRNHPTNVLAFAMADGEPVGNPAELGDIVISLPTAAREARRQHSTLHQRLTELLTHGLLHLLGYDHERSATEAQRMFNEEKRLYTLTLQYERRESMPRLAINVDHIATLRQARGITEPDPVLAAGICELAGAAGIVVHLREDRRHIQDRDVRLLRQTIKTSLNLEMGATEEIIGIALDIGPDMVTLVPEKRQELTTEGGLNVTRQKKKLQKAITRFSEAGIPVSLFIDPEPRQIIAAKAIGATFVEIHTGRYCDATTEAERNDEFALVAQAAELACEEGLRVNAGHGLNYQTTQRVAALPTIDELSIGHGVMARAILVGLDQAVREMLALMHG